MKSILAIISAFNIILSVNIQNSYSSGTQHTVFGNYLFETSYYVPVSSNSVTMRNISIGPYNFDLPVIGTTPVFQWTYTYNYNKNINGTVKLTFSSAVSGTSSDDVYNTAVVYSTLYVSGATIKEFSGKNRTITLELNNTQSFTITGIYRGSISYSDSVRVVGSSSIEESNTEFENVKQLVTYTNTIKTTLGDMLTQLQTINSNLNTIISKIGSSGSGGSGGSTNSSSPIIAEQKWYKINAFAFWQGKTKDIYLNENLLLPIVYAYNSKYNSYKSSDYIQLLKGNNVYYSWIYGDVSSYWKWYSENNPNTANTDSRITFSKKVIADYGGYLLTEWRWVASEDVKITFDLNKSSAAGQAFTPLYWGLEDFIPDEVHDILNTPYNNSYTQLLQEIVDKLDDLNVDIQVDENQLKSAIHGALVNINIDKLFGIDEISIQLGLGNIHADIETHLTTYQDIHQTEETNLIRFADSWDEVDFTTDITSFIDENVQSITFVKNQLQRFVTATPLKVVFTSIIGVGLISFYLGMRRES